MNRIFICCAALILLSSCSHERIKVIVANSMPVDRKSDMIEIPLPEITVRLHDVRPSELIVTDAKGNEIVSQLLYDGQAEPAALLFQPAAAANSDALYFIRPGVPGKYEPMVFGRFVPERMDDYAWENNRVAFRVYGPALVATDGPSNGLDVWIKRTDKLVIDRWYADDLAGKKSYHNDNGEGCDCYKVGRTLGAGAMAPFVNDSLWLGSNFEKWQTLDNGPLRTTVRLTYPPYNVNGVMVTETRTISLDAGSQLNRITVEFAGPDQVIPVAAGIVKREEGRTLMTAEGSGTIAYSLDGGEGGFTYLGVVLTTPETKRAELRDHTVIVTDYTPGTKLTYYTGAGWSKWGFESDTAWNDYIDLFSQRLSRSLKVTLE